MSLNVAGLFPTLTPSVTVAPSGEVFTVTLPGFAAGGTDSGLWRRNGWYRRRRRGARFAVPFLARLVNCEKPSGGGGEAECNDRAGQCRFLR